MTPEHLDELRAERDEFQLRLTACKQSQDTLRAQLEAYTQRNLELLEALDEKLGVEAADEWLSHRFHQVCDERDSLKATLAALQKGEK